MKVVLHHSSDMVLIENRLYDLDDLKRFLINHYPALVIQCYVKAITKSHHRYPRTVFTYDWNDIIKRAGNAVLPIHDFLIHNKAGRRYPDQQQLPTVI